MPIPDYQTAMLPLLLFTADGKEHTIAQAAEVIAQQFNSI
jgi:restriction system protein